MRKLLDSFFGKRDTSAAANNAANIAKTTALSSAADHWSRWQEQTDAEKPQWIDWGEHPLFLSLIYQELFGASDFTLFDYLKQGYPAFATHKALSLCSGDGGFEHQLVRHGVFGAMTGMDISPARVARAQAEYGADCGKLDFINGDVNAGNYGKALYDAVFAKASLHHIENLEAAFEGMQRCLRPGGHLVTIDFFGPTRFQWTDCQLDLAKALLQQIPPALRTTTRGVLKTGIDRPTVAEMIEADPSEAVRSAEVHGFIRRHFAILEEFDIGGTLFNLVFTPDIIGNLQPGNAEHAQLVQRVFQQERELIRAGQLPSDFKFIIAAKRN